jgi:hypothetical protein
MDARIDLINEQFEKETALLDKNGEQYQLLAVQREKAIHDIRIAFVQDWVSRSVEAVNAVMGAMQSYFSLINAQGQDDLERDRQANDEKKENLKKRLERDAISQAEYNRQIEALDKDFAKKQHEQRVKEFRRQQALSLVQASMNLAQSITKVWSEWGSVPPAAAAMSAIAAAANAIQVGMIASQKPPAFAKGGIAPGVPSGPSHAQGGIKLIDGRTGRPVGEMEGGEPIISRETYAHNADLVNALLDAGQNGGRMRWMHDMPPAINQSAIQRTAVANAMFARGGVTPAQASAPGFRQSVTTGGNTLPDMQRVQRTLESIKELLALPSRSYVVYGDLKEADREYSMLKKLGSFKQS